MLNPKRNQRHLKANVYVTCGSPCRTSWADSHCELRGGQQQPREARPGLLCPCSGAAGLERWLQNHLLPPEPALGVLKMPRVSLFSRLTLQYQVLLPNRRSNRVYSRRQIKQNASTARTRPAESSETPKQESRGVHLCFL